MSVGARPGTAESGCSLVDHGAEVSSTERTGQILKIAEFRALVDSPFSKKAAVFGHSERQCVYWMAAGVSTLQTPASAGFLSKCVQRVNASPPPRFMRVVGHEAGRMQ